jgi:streptomycin 6-kinase
MSDRFEPMVDLTDATAAARKCASKWGLELGESMALANVSFVAAVGDDQILKAAWGGDDESLHEGDALKVWNGEGAVRLIRRDGLVLLEERAVPGSDLSEVPEDAATAIAVALAKRLWRPGQPPFRAVEPEVWRELDEAERKGSELVPLARELYEEIHGGEGWLVHGDFHHHNILLSGDEYVAIDPKPYLADREYDVPTYLWNPIGNHHMEDRDQTRRRIAAFVEAGLDDFLIRAWTVIRGSYLRLAPDYVLPLRELVS